VRSLEAGRARPVRYSCNRNGFVSVGAARADYGVIVDEHTFEVDATPTTDARAAVG
jgi:hypothetical protein